MQGERSVLLLLVIKLHIPSVHAFALMVLLQRLLEVAGVTYGPFAHRKSQMAFFLSAKMTPYVVYPAIPEQMAVNPFICGMCPPRWQTLALLRKCSMKRPMSTVMTMESTLIARVTGLPMLPLSGWANLCPSSVTMSGNDYIKET